MEIHAPVLNSKMRAFSKCTLYLKAFYKNPSHLLIITETSKLAVLLVISVEDLFFGNLYDPSLLAVHEDIIVITANIRLGVFGEFLLWLHSCI